MQFVFLLAVFAGVPALAHEVSDQSHGPGSGLRARRLAAPGSLCAAAVVLPFDPTRPFDFERSPLAPNLACAERFSEIRALHAAPREVLTVGYLYYRDVRQLESHVRAWDAFPARILAETRFLIVDDGSPDGARAAPVVEALAAARARVTVVEIDQDIVWNIGGARNLLFAVAPTEVVFLLDMDVGVPWELIENILDWRATLKKGCVVSLHFPRRYAAGGLPPSPPLHPHPAVMLTSRRSYWHLGGCDEDLVGRHGGTDPIFRFKLAQANKKQYRTCMSEHVGRRVPPVPPLEQITRGGGPREPRENGNKQAGVTEGKRTGSLPWATEVLRFSWHTAFSSSENGTGV
mmetsp:Transcript_24716/g.74171  ORF Transcript_24716/g.74171 Transcript_24716/m.74171 type:complete len:347 (-) Transcript_24716:25-1065(-)